jgi:hypothetical protein
MKKKTTKMAKATIEYNLADSDDLIEFNRANKATDMALCIWHITYNLKKEIYRILENNPDSKDSDFELVDTIFSKIYENIDEHGIKIDDIIN